MSKCKQNRDFETFKKEFKKWQQRFGLNGYQVYFEYMELKDCFANIIVCQHDMVATVSLDTRKSPDYNVRKSAKHEALHLLTNKLQSCAFNRHVSENEILEASEELVVKLQGLIE